VLEKPQIVETKAQDIAVIHVVVPAEEIQRVMAPGLQELLAEVQRQGVKQTGPWFTHHLKMPGATFDFEIGVPVEKPVEASGRVRPSRLRATQVARTTYVGPYEGLGQAWGEFMKWINQNTRAEADDFWEVYALGPESGADASQYRTELNRPLAR
jgi:effector-binding domain-containing protein